MIELLISLYSLTKTKYLAILLFHLMSICDEDFNQIEIYGNENSSNYQSPEKLTQIIFFIYL